MGRRIAALLAGSLALLPIAAWAQGEESPRSYTIDEIATDVAYGFCPLFLAGQFELDSPQLAERGFGSKPETTPNAQFGEIRLVTAERDDGRVAFGGAKEKVCLVLVGGPQRGAALNALRERMVWTGLDFRAVDNPKPASPGTTVETFAATADGQTLYLQLIQSFGPNPVIAAQLYAMAK